MNMPTACEAHQPLEARVLSFDITPSDADLLAYTELVDTCADCRRLASVAGGVLPTVLEQGGLSTPDEGLAHVHQALSDNAQPERRLLDDLQRSPVRSRPVWGILGNMKRKPKRNARRLLGETTSSSSRTTT